MLLSILWVFFVCLSLCAAATNSPLEWQSSSKSTSLTGDSALSTALAKYFAIEPPMSAALTSSFAEFIYEMEEDNRYIIPSLGLQLLFDISLGIHFILSSDGEAALINWPHESLDYHSHRLLNDLECCEREKCDGLAKKYIEFKQIIPDRNTNQTIQNVTDTETDGTLPPLATIQVTIHFSPFHTENCTTTIVPSVTNNSEEQENETENEQINLQSYEVLRIGSEENDIPDEYGLRECISCSWARKAQFFFQVFEIKL